MAELGVRLIDANLAKIFDQLRGTQNLYVKLTSSHGGSDEREVARSAVCLKGDLHPVWNERLAIRQDGAKTLKLGVFAKHSIRSDTSCGEATLDASLVILESQRGMHGSGNPCEMQLWKKGMPVGKLRAEFEFSAALPAGPDLGALLGRPSELDATLRAWYRAVAQAEGDARVIQRDHVSQIVELLAARVVAPPLAKAEADELFWQFETSGAARLQEDEAVRLLRHTLRRYRARPVEHRDCSAKYEIQREIGRGQHSVVSLATARDSSQSVIVKMYGQVSWQERREKLALDFEILMSLSHSKIARVVDVFQDWGNVYVVQEPHFGGDLTNALEKAQGAGVRVDEQWLACLVRQVLDGLGFLHASGVVHCNVKEQNVRLAAGQTDWHRPQVVVSNCGLAKVCCQSARTCGTPGYMPPEVWERGLWTPRGDVFSLGAMMFVLWTGRPPFCPPDGKGSAQEVARRTMVEEPQMGSGSAALQGLVRSMMQKDFAGRPVAARALQDAWFSAASAGGGVDMGALARLSEAQQRRTDLHRALHAEAARLNYAQLVELKNMFASLDNDQSGSVSAEELRRGLRGKWADEETERLVSSLVGSHSGEVPYDEFMGCLLATKVPEENALLTQLFHEVDRDRSGFLSLSEVAELAKRPTISRMLGGVSHEDLMRQLDVDGDGRVTLEEFGMAVRGCCT